MTDTELMLKVTRNAIAPITDNEDAADRLHKAGLIVKEAKRIKSMMDELVMDFIEEHGEFELAGIRYYNGKSKTTKANDHAEVLTALNEAFKSDAAKVAGFLASDAWKYGAARELLGDEQFAELFTVSVDRDLKTGKPKKRAKSTSTRFLPTPQRDDDRPPIDSEDK